MRHHRTKDARNFSCFISTSWPKNRKERIFLREYAGHRKKKRQQNSQRHGTVLSHGGQMTAMRTL